MAISPWKKIKLSLRNANQFLGKKPDKALDEAYNEALAIAALEKEYFNGQKICPKSGNYSESAQSYFNSQLEQSLNEIQIKLAEFNASRPAIDIAKKPSSDRDKKIINKQLKFSVIKKLEFIDEVIAKYQTSTSSVSSSSPAIVDFPTSPKLVSLGKKKPKPSSELFSNSVSSSTVDSDDNKAFEKIKGDKPETSFLPRSLLGTLNRIKKELDPAAEDEVIEKFRKSKVKTIISIRFILLLILVPLLVHQISKITLVGPLVDRFVKPPEEIRLIFINDELEEEALTELQKYAERIDFEILIGKRPELEPKEKHELLHEKAAEIAEEYKSKSSNAIKNVFCDIISIVTFCLIFVKNKKEVDIVKSFMDDLIYGLSDSAKAFIIILLTDMFVGFHSPHGWEVILISVARHFGLPENREFNFLFIATFPVILDAVFKYWIFRYLNRSSPSAVATYKNMNE